MDINSLTIGEAKELAKIFCAGDDVPRGLNSMIGKKVIIRTYTAGVHFGELIEKYGEEVILKNSRRLWYWKTVASGISLSEVSINGVHSDSKICAAVPLLWLQAIEIIPCSDGAIKNLESADVYRA